MTLDEPYTVADRVGQVIIEELDLSPFDRPAVGAIVDRLAAEQLLAADPELRKAALPSPVTGQREERP